MARAALRGIVVGDRTGVPRELDARWRAVGIYHVLSVSGLHLAVVAGLAFALLRRLVAASPIGGRVRPARWAAPPAFALAVAYTLVTGAQLATLRALIVIALALGAEMLDRPIRLIDALGAAAIIILLWRPGDLFDPSFQLSFTAALTLALIPRTEVRGVGGWIVRSITASAWVALTTAPLTAYHFHQVQPGGIVGNLILTPLLELFALPIALVGIALGSLGEPLLVIAISIVSFVDRLCALLEHGVLVGRVAVATGTAMTVITALSLLLVSVRRPRRRAVGWAALCLAWSFARMPLPAGALRVTFLDVGQGDAAVIELPDGGVWLVDAGGHANARDLAAASRTGTTIQRFLAATDHERIDVAIVSHPHPDHYLGLASVGVPIGELWSSADPEASSPSHHPRDFGTISAALAARGTRIVHPPLGRVVARAGVELVVWAPRFQSAAGAPPICASDPVRSVNDNSLVVEVRYRGRSILFTGDLEEEGEAEAIAAGVARVDIVKVPHHGSPTSSSPAFVAATRPAVAVLSLGRGNPFGFPSPEVVARWRAAGAAIARTDTDGAITVVVEPTGDLDVERFVHAMP